MKIITLTLNPAFDMHCYTKQFLPYHENSVEVTALDAGGKGVNISRTLKALGIASSALVVLGDENGALFRDRLTADGIDGVYVEAKGRIRENITIHESSAPETRISARGFSADERLLARVSDALDGLIDGSTVVAFSGSLPTGVPTSLAVRMLCEMKEKGAKIVIDSRSFTLDDIKAVHPWLIKPNEEEIALYSNQSVTDPESAARAALALQRDCAENVMISLGGDGAVLATANGVYTASAPEIEVRSTVGAGDSSIAGFLAATLERQDDRECLKYAVAVGSAACMTEGTKPPRREDVSTLLPLVKAEKLK